VLGFFSVLNRYVVPVVLPKNSHVRCPVMGCVRTFRRGLVASLRRGVAASLVFLVVQDRIVMGPFCS